MLAKIPTLWYFTSLIDCYPRECIFLYWSCMHHWLRGCAYYMHMPV